MKTKRASEKYGHICIRCDGGGQCPTCGCAEGCPDCDGTGFDNVVTNIAAYEKACDELNEESKAAGMTGLSWDYMDDDCITLGRTNGKRTVLASDFAIKNPS